MVKLIFPEVEFKIKKEGNREVIFDEFRKKWVILTPEEWVRQNMLQYLTKVKKYPASLIAIEKEILLGELKKRCDIVVYNSEGVPFMIVECKEMNISLSGSALDQILRYHITLSAAYLVITNGSNTIVYEKGTEGFLEVSDFPER